ncbi:MAG TPA: GNAT family N-acetyltransferase [Bryobacteraceae bacterium]|nr:GNAT family N-acetyltransferase [Bryobacteraceae bacterium]
MSTIRIATPNADEARALIPALAGILIDCVEGGASVSFMLPIDRRTAEEFYEGVVEKIATGSTILFAACLDDELAGTVQLSPEQKPNQPHRADVHKLLVGRRARNRGIAQALMAAVEETARARGRWLLCLDTATGSPAERLYEKLGWQRLGVMPRHAMWPQGGFCDTTFFWKDLSRHA